MNCSVISVNILAPLESRIFSISLTCGRTEEETGRRVTQTPALGGSTTSTVQLSTRSIDSFGGVVDECAH